jgi:hypothetical protein
MLVMATCSPIPTPPPAPLTEAAFCAWLGNAASGDAITYHRGALARETCPSLNLLSADERVRVARLSSRALKLAEAGHVHLVQRRRGFEDYEYLAIARRRPRQISPLLLRRILVEAA